MFTLICRSASSRAIDFAKPFNPALEAAYAAALSWPTSPIWLEIKMRLASDFKNGLANWASLKFAFRFTLMV